MRLQPSVALLVFSVFAFPVSGEEKVFSNFFSTNDGIKLHYISAGEQGSYVVLIHAYGANAEGNWLRTGIVQDLAKKHRVVALDCRNHGLSDKPNPNRFGIAEDVIELMDYLKIEKAHLHGYSMGGGFVGQLLLSHQDRFITASMGGSGFGEVEPDKFALIPEDKESPRRMPASDIRLLPKQVLTFITVPVLSINGEFDRPNEKTTRMKREIDNYKRVVIRGRGHGSAVLDKKYRQELVKFINRNDP